MEKQALIAAVRELIGEAEIKQAIDLLEQELAKSPAYASLYRETLETGALYNKTRQDETRGVISFENAQLNYNRVTDRLLDILDRLEKDDLEPEPPGRSKSSRRYLRVLYYGLPLLLIAIVAVVKKPWNVPPKEQNPCPAFKGDALKVLVLPFFRVNEDAGRAEGLLIEKIEDFCRKCDLEAEVALMENLSVNRLLDFDDAARIAAPCKADFVVWGRSERANNRNIVKTRFRYLGPRADDIHFSRLTWGESQIDTVEVLSNILTRREFTADLEHMMLLVLGAGATMRNDPDRALCVLENVPSSDTSLLLMKNMLMAENFLQKGQLETALKIYDEALATHPDYWLALNNRGVLRMKTENYLGAIEDFSAVLQHRQDPDVLLARAYAFKNSEQLIKAKMDLEMVAKQFPQKRAQVAPLLKETNVAIEQEQRKLQEIDRQNNVPSPQLNLTQKVDIYRKLGDNVQAYKLAEKGLQLNPNDPKLLATQVESLLKMGKEKEAIETLKAAKDRGVSPGTIAQHSKVVEVFLKDKKVQ